MPKGCLFDETKQKDVLQEHTKYSSKSYGCSVCKNQLALFQSKTPNMCNVVAESFLPALYSVEPFLLLADLDINSDSAEIFQFCLAGGGKNWTDVKIQFIHGHSDFCDPSMETDIFYRVPELSERVYCLFIDNQ